MAYRFGISRWANDFVSIQLLDNEHVCETDASLCGGSDFGDRDLLNIITFESLVVLTFLMLFIQIICSAICDVSAVSSPFHRFSRR